MLRPARVPAAWRGARGFLALLGAWWLIALACTPPEQVSPNDTRLQPPAVNSGLLFTDFLRQLNLFPRGMLPIPWITAPTSPAQLAPSLTISGWGPRRGDRPWPGDPARSPAINLYQLSGQDCNGSVTRSLLATTVVDEGRNWSTALTLPPAGLLLVATTQVGESESGPSNTIIIGEAGLRPTLDPLAPITDPSAPLTLTGTGPAGYCVVLVRDGELNRFHATTVGEDGRWTLTEVPSDEGNAHTYQVRLLALGLDSAAVTGSAPVRPNVAEARRLLDAMAIMADPWDSRVDAPIQSAVGQRSAGLYADVIDQFDVDWHEFAGRYRPRPGMEDYDTRCNIFAADVMRAMGVPLPTKGNFGKGRADNNSHWTDPMTALAVDLNAYFNHQLRWQNSANDPGTLSGWVEIDATSAEGLARLIAHVAAGKPALASEPGHIAVIRPEQPGVQRWQDLNIAQAGRDNTLRGVLIMYFRRVEPQFFIHD